MISFLSNINMTKLTDSAHQMVDKVLSRLPALLVGIVVFCIFYLLSIFLLVDILAQIYFYHSPQLRASSGDKKRGVIHKK